MNILLVCKKFPYPPKDGETIAIFNHIRGYSKAGHSVTVASINTGKHHVNITQIPLEVSRIADFHSTDVDTTPKLIDAFFNLFQGHSYHISRFVSKPFEEKLKSILSSKDFDIVQLEGLYLAPYVETIRKFSKVPIIMRSHNVEHEIWQRIAENLEHGLKRWYLNLQAKRLRAFEVSMLNQYDATVPITKRDGEIFRALGCDLPMFASPSGMAPENYVIDKAKMEFPSIFFLGGLDWIPNQEGLKWFIENVWRRVTATHKNCKFYIAGRNAPAWLKKLNEKNVKVIGEIESATAFMNTKAVMVVPLFSGSGMRIKIIEGMAMGKVIISTSIGAEGIGCSDGENIIIADTAEKFHSAVERCTDDKAYSDKIGNNAAAFIRRHYDNDRFIASLVEFYSGLIIASK